MNYHQVLEVIRKPVTKKEIVEATGLTLPQVTQAFRALALKGAPYQTLGYGDNMHFYMSHEAQKKAGITEPPLYQKVLDLIDTQEWWTMDEITSILELDSRTVGNKIRFIIRRGYADIDIERYEGNKMRYYVNRKED